MERKTLNAECCTIKQRAELTRLDECLMSCSITTPGNRGHAKHEKQVEMWGGEVLPLYCPDSMMPSVVEAKLLEVTHDSERFRPPGTLG